ncbi:phosducin-like protein, putative [Plasmodium berghei]|uniref:Phosducin-like protein 1, putative n=2 Tax=Plasmodium berghei TaxID=5821 RepID=A0A509ANT1_PLABA|nr:phosducin-like protein 1, putative [Plasmodium berghei ANKA]CXI80369.1 phosducin-like protein, putative [Plasmodium berghei]SCM25403.1 phosducin-like protein, putative [Plasmodium berghei]SCN27356.1 phosducin-like protein, putative [Plasmodium berghei]SCO62004.1 phosducin-like protein, putative [Plasmodium berghei]SCO63781.1 phosducin-like protein, putative [Plasmodium berghei]|eukprot:XP_034422989.1 phosducin-like protein 1, putative [Plasmodium berghei ANKA]
MSTTNPTIETTEWDDLQRKFGNIPPLEKEIKEEEIYLKNIDRIENEDIFENKNLEELKILEEENQDDEYLKIINKYKMDRINEINKNRLLNIYGEVYEISKETFITEINEASKKNPLNNTNKNEEINEINEKKKTGTFVVLHLYSDNVISCKILNQILKELANKHKYIKFTKGVYNKIIENYPENKLPTILIYYNGSCIHQICNLINNIKGGLNNLNLKSFENFLKKYNILKQQKCTNSTSSDENTDSNDSDNYTKKQKKNIKTQKQYMSFNLFSNKNKNEEYDSSSNESEMKSKGYSSSLMDRKINLSRL